jgi:hypothetical protein
VIEVDIYIFLIDERDLIFVQTKVILMKIIIIIECKLDAMI